MKADFSGKTLEIMEFKSKEGEIIERKNVVEFRQVMLDVSCGRLYEAWDEHMMDEITDFQIEKGV
jgi:hypothetical protein